MSEARFSTADVMRLTGASHRQVNHWCDLGVLRPVVPANGSGTAREWDEPELRVVRVLVALTALGVPLHTCGHVARQLRAAPLEAPGWRSLLFIDEDGYLYDEPVGSGWLVDLGALFSESTSA